MKLLVENICFHNNTSIYYVFTCVTSGILSSFYPKYLY